MEKAAFVAVLDDDERVLNSLRSFLESVGHNVLVFPSAEAFLESECAATCSCVVSDVTMNGMSGLALRQMLRKEQPDLEVILMTAHRGSLALSESDTADRLRFFEKPFDTQRLLTAIETLARQI